MNVDDFVDAVRRVADGGTALDPEVVAQLFSRARAARGPVAARARGARPDGGGPLERRRSPAALYLSVGAVEKHIASIFTKLGCGRRRRITAACSRCSRTCSPAVDDIE